MYRQYAVIGNPVLHSLSPLIHQRAFDLYQIPARYFAYEAEDFHGFMEYFHGKENHGKNFVPYSYLDSQKDLYTPNQKLQPYFKKDFSFPLQGLSITIPHKKNVLAVADRISYKAQLAGAANTLYWENDENDKRILVAENTDIAGFFAPLEKYLQGNPPFRTALVYGAGGAACAVVAALLHIQDLEQIWIGARREEQANELINHIRENHHLLTKYGLNTEVRISYQPLDHDEYPCDLAINTIPQWDDKAESPRQDFSSVRFAYDLTYKETPFLQSARKNPHCHIKDGKTMFIEQAKAQFRLWTGLEIPERCWQDIF